MADLFCVICGEPCEDYYVYHEMTSSERERFLSGKGCECCKGKNQKVEPRTNSLTRLLITLWNQKTQTRY